MQDLVTLGTGNSRLMKSNIPSSTTLAQLISMLNNGTFPYDTGPLNSVGISQQGTALNKENLLTDSTAALYGLGTDAVPDDVLVKAKSLISTAQSTAEGRAQIVSGSYVGTGRNGSSNPNSLTFSKVPYLLIIEYVSGSDRIYGQWYGLFSPRLYGSSYSDMAYRLGVGQTSSSSYARTDGNTVYWYSDENEANQLNTSGQTYKYWAIV